MNDLFWQVTEEERFLGYCKKEALYHCLICEATTEEGYIYPLDKAFVDANKQMSIHIAEAHGSVFDALIKMDKKKTGLSEHQSKIIQMFYEGMSDHEIQQTLDIGSISTIRNHRYALKEKEKQAKMFMTIMDLLNRVTDDKKVLVKPHATATMIDERYATTLEEQQKVIDKYFSGGKLSTFYVKEKHKIILLGEIIKSFETIRRYRESEVDALLKEIYLEDYVLIRRYLIQYGFMDREKDGSSYWVKEMTMPGQNKKKTVKKQMDPRKKELKQAYKVKLASEAIESGVYQVRNMLNGKVYISTARNIKQLEGVRFQLNNRSFMNTSLQADWTALGEENFAIEVLESFEEGEDQTDVSKALRALEQKWLENRQPYGDKGYHRDRNKRQ